MTLAELHIIIKLIIGNGNGVILINYNKPLFLITIRMPVKND